MIRLSTASFRRHLPRIAPTLFVLAAVGCGGSHDSPSAPSGPTPPATGVQISNVNVRPLGLRNVVCGIGTTANYKTIDEMSMDFTVGAGSLIGTRLVNSTSNRYFPVATPIAACSLSEGPCANLDRVCVVSGSATKAGSVKAYVVADWTPTIDWQLSIESELNVRSNQYAVRVTRNEGLPYGDRSGVIELKMARCGVITGDKPPTSETCALAPQFGESYGLAIYAYNPHRFNRTVAMKFEVFNSQGKLIKTIGPTTSNESNSNGDPFLVTLTTISPGYDGTTSFWYRFVGSIREFEGTTLIAEDAKEITVQRED